MECFINPKLDKTKQVSHPFKLGEDIKNMYESDAIKIPKTVYNSNKDSFKNVGSMTNSFTNTNK